MKTSLIIISLVFAFASTTFAQPQRQNGEGREQRSPEDRAKRRTEQLVKSLELNEDQAKKVNDLNLKYSKKFSELMSDQSEREQKREKMKELRDAQDVELKAILTPTQIERLDVVKKEQAERRKKAMEERKNNQPDKRGRQRGSN